MKIFHLREKSSQHLLLPVWVVLGLVGRKLELAVPFSQLLQMKVHLDMFGIKEHPLPWLTEILNGVEHANFFEARATEYSKVATSGNWDGKEGVWSTFDKKLKSFG